MASAEPTFDFLDPPSEQGDVGTLGNYRVIRELGRGGMGFVFHAQDKRLQRDVALKVMNQKVAATPNSRKRFLHEARAMAAVHHDNVATIFEVGERSGTPFMAMEMLKGSTLEVFNRGDKRLEYEEIIRYATEIARGLAAAHAKGIVHRDIKPANIWIESNKDRIKILDFGLALAATPVDQLAGRGAVIGTPGYLSPEQARTEPLDDRSDLYSLGVVLYELCTGRLPLNGKTVAGQLIAILAHRPQPITEINPEIPLPLADLIHRLLYKEPRARVPSAATLEKELARVHRECHAKSEVAQTINKLQQSLQKVVQQTVPVEPEVVEVLDPFAALPDTPIAAAPRPSAPVQGAAVHGTPAHGTPLVSPVPGTPPATTAYTHPHARKPAPAATAPAWQKYALPAAIVAVVMISLPIMAFVFSGMGANDEPIVIAQNDPPESQANEPLSDRQAQNKKAANNNKAANNSKAANNNARKNNTANKTQGKSAANKSGQNQNKSGPNTSANKNANRTSNQSAKRNAANRNRNANRNPENPNDPGNQAARGDSGTVAGAGGRKNTVAMTTNPADKPPGASGFEPTPSGRPTVNSDAVKPSDTVPPAPVEATSDLQWTSISTVDGRGADTMVQIGTTQKLGLKPSIGIHKRGKVESHHSYLRFDLASIEQVKEEVVQAELILTIVGRNRPEGASVRVHGLTLEGMPLWREEGPGSLVWTNTPSKVGLDSFPVLATATIGGSSGDAGQNTVRLTSPELAAFIRSASTDTVTFVIAGESKLSMPLRFVAREGAAKKAPTLRIEAPKEGTNKKGDRQRADRQRGGQNR